MLWQAPPLDLLRLVYQETHVQNILEASGYRIPTLRILRALKSTINANVIVGVSIITAAAFLKEQDDHLNLSGGLNKVVR